MNVWCMLWVWYVLARPSPPGRLAGELYRRCGSDVQGERQQLGDFSILNFVALKKVGKFQRCFLIRFSWKKRCWKILGPGGFWHKVVSMKYSYCRVRITPDLSKMARKVAEARKDGSELRRVAFAEGTQLAVAWPFEALRKTVRWKEHLLTLFPKSGFTYCCMVQQSHCQPPFGWC